MKVAESRDSATDTIYQDVSFDQLNVCLSMFSYFTPTPPTTTASAAAVRDLTARIRIVRIGPAGLNRNFAPQTHTSAPKLVRTQFVVLDLKEWLVDAATDPPPFRLKLSAQSCR